MNSTRFAPGTTLRGRGRFLDLKSDAGIADQISSESRSVPVSAYVLLDNVSNS